MGCGIGDHYQKKKMDELIKGTSVRTGLVLGHGQSFLFSRNRPMAQPHSKI